MSDMMSGVTVTYRLEKREQFFVSREWTRWKLHDAAWMTQEEADQSYDARNLRGRPGIEVRVVRVTIEPLPASDLA